MLCSSFVSFGAVKSWFFLSITVFGDVQATTLCDAQNEKELSSVFKEQRSHRLFLF